MLIDNNGRAVRAEKLPKHGKAREAALASVREVHVPAAPRDSMFKLGSIARLVEGKK